MSNKIARLAKNIYDKAITISSSKPDFINLKNTLNKLYNLYRAIFIDDFRKYGQNLKNVEGVANNKKRIAVNLREKTNVLKELNITQQRKPMEPMYISLSANRP
jgi:hypothetical protein